MLCMFLICFKSRQVMGYYLLFVCYMEGVQLGYYGCYIYFLKKGGDVIGWCIFLGNGKVVYILVVVMFLYQVILRFFEMFFVISRFKVGFSFCFFYI